jgi:molybdopterin synthase sulfur carrier subunit
VSVTVKLPTQLRASVGGAPSVASTGATVGEVLDGVYAEHPDLRERICDDEGELRRFVNVYVNGEDIRYADGLQTTVAEGGEVQILPAVAGG